MLIDYVDITVRDPERSARFYQSLVGTVCLQNSCRLLPMPVSADQWILEVGSADEPSDQL
jgi:catechol-2,3-dioxygenase